MRRFAFPVLLAAVAAVWALAVVGAQHLSASTPERSTCEAAPVGTDRAAALRVQRRFLETAVLRRHTGCSFDLVTDQLRGGLSRREWAGGNIPVQPFPTARPDLLRATATLRSSSAFEPSTFVRLEADDLGPFTFELVLVARDGRWRVDYWAAFGGNVVPAAAG